MSVDNLKINRTDIEKIVLVGGRNARAAQTIINGLEEKPDYIINGGHFVNSPGHQHHGLTITDAIVNGEFINGGNYNEMYEDEGFAWNNINDLTFTTTSTAIKNKYDNYLAGSPCLVKNGVLNENKYLNSVFARQKTKRIGMGITDKYLIFSFPKNNCTAKNVAQKLMGFGCKNAILLDGGGSQYVGKVNSGKVSHLDANCKNRPVSTWICIYMKKTKTFPRVYEVVTSKLNMYSQPDINSALYKREIPSGVLTKGSRITVFDIVYNEKETRYYAKSYGYYVALTGIKDTQ